MNDNNILWRILGVSRLLYKQQKYIESIQNLERWQKEIYYANLFHDTTRNSQWFIIKSISPSGWALNYASLYFLYRVLDKMKPQNIIEFGLGQSSKLIYQYVNFYDNANAVTYEHDTKWIEFFKNEHKDYYDINIYVTELENVVYNQCSTLSYKNNCDELKGQKFDLILVDAPFGSEHYSRSQVLNLVPDCLCSSFCIMLHDSERNGEKETISELLDKLDSCDIKYCTSTISSNKDLFVVCSDDLKFLTTI